ncbi:hypothetical protein KAS79_00350 [Candidatus Parcubacteria bacterium]|nr:hypothetical protein [Candidatus Parcubacteria bacterium]
MTISNKVKKNIFNLKIGLFSLSILVGALLMLYVFQINEITKISYLTKTYEKQINEISQENKDLEINHSQLSTLENIEILVQNSNFEKVKQIKYIQILDSTVAAK